MEDPVVTIHISYDALSMMFSLFIFIPFCFIVVILLLFTINNKLNNISIPSSKTTIPSIPKIITNDIIKND